MQVVLPDSVQFCRTVLEFEDEFSEADLREFSELNPGYIVEREGARTVVMSPSGSGASFRSGEIYYQLREWARTAGGLVYESSAGFRLDDGSILSPDVAWVSDEKAALFSEEEMEGFLPACPDLVVEVMSPSDRLSVAQEKCGRWVEAGAGVAILVNPAGREVEMRTRSTRHRTQGADSIEVPGYPGLVLDMSRVWGDPRRRPR